MAAPKPTDPLPLRFVKHPMVWSGVGLLIRYGDDFTLTGNLWKTVGVLSLAWGIGSTVMTQEHDPYKLE
jgi:hypothetical protein